MIFITQHCPVCDGTGQVPNADWLEYLRGCRYSAAGTYSASGLRPDAFFAQRGYAEVPLVLQPCNCCDGNKTVVGKISHNDFTQLQASNSLPLLKVSEQ